MPPDLSGANWKRYEWIDWGGPDYRLRIGVGREGQLTGIIDGVEFSQPS